MKIIKSVVGDVSEKIYSNRQIEREKKERECRLDKHFIYFIFHKHFRIVKLFVRKRERERAT